MSTFLRQRGDKVEREWMNDRYTAAERASALHVLSGCVVIVRHPYRRDPGSGSGNCWCGRHQSSSLHQIIWDREPEAVDSGHAETPEDPDDSGSDRA